MSSETIEEKTNAAQRVLWAYQRIERTPADSAAPMLDIFVGVFEVDLDADNPRRPVEVGRHLVAALEQLDAVRAEIPRTFPQLAPGLYTAQFNRLKALFDPRNLYNAFRHHAPSLMTADTRLALDMLAQLLPSDQRPIPESAVAQLLALVEEAEEALRDDELMDAPLKLYVLRTFAAVRTAVQEYPIRGAAALRDAYRLLLATLAEYAPMDEEGSANGKGAVVWRKAKTAAAALIAAVVYAGTAVESVEHLTKAAHAIHAAIPEATARLALPGPKPPKLLPATTGATAGHAAAPTPRE